jgi:phosphate acyltransferase
LPGSLSPAAADAGDRQAVVVAVDCTGADRGPAEVAAGAALAAREGVHSLLFGPAGELEPALAGVSRGMVELVDASVSIAKSPDPASAVRRHRDSSIVQAAVAVADDRAQALVCAGGTGAALAAGLFHVKRARGIYRPALALPLPVPGRPVTLLDVGANAQARPEHLEQFAFMGAALARTLFGVERPRVGLLSNGEEAARGSDLVRETHARLGAPPARARQSTAAYAGSPPRDDLPAGQDLSEAAGQDYSEMDGPRGRAPARARGWADARSESPFEFVGNVEGGDLTSGVVDVIVTDGFTGNVALKVMEGVSQAMLAAIRDAATSSSRAKLGGLLLRSSLGAFRDEIDPEGQGGAYLLGLRRLGVVPHGGFSRRGFARAILRAAQGAQEDLVGHTQAALAEAGALRTAPADVRVER